MKKPVALIIMDGFGYTENKEGSAIALAKTPNIDKFKEEYPNTLIHASGLDVGLPDGQMGNSEVGHTNIGAGRIVYQDLTRITKAIEDGDFFKNEVLSQAMENGKKHALHIMGLLSDGGVHSHIDHLKALIKMAKEEGVEKVYVHAFTDGRDTDPQSAINYVKDVESYMSEIGCGEFATVSGRYYAMDRDKRWERVELCYNALALGKGEKALSAVEAVQNSYDKGNNDEFILPTVITKDNQPVAKISEDDSVIFFNFRPDRAIQISTAITNPEATTLKTYQKLNDITFVSMMLYSESVKGLVNFGLQELDNMYGDVIAERGLKQLRIAETEKYAHVTYFFDGGVDKELPGEKRILVPSPKEVATYDLKPEMSAYTVCDKLVAAIKSGEYDVIIINFANPDMVGHTGVEAAAIKAVEAVDECVGKAVEAIKEVDGTMFICADHGNAEQLVDYETGAPFTAHTTNPVPFILVNYDENYTLREGGCLADIVPTLIETMGMKQPAEMTGKSLLVRK